jgi:hypothetical protein
LAISQKDDGRARCPRPARAVGPTLDVVEVSIQREKTAFCGRNAGIAID